MVIIIIIVAATTFVPRKIVYSRKLKPSESSITNFTFKIQFLLVQLTLSRSCPFGTSVPTSTKHKGKLNKAEQTKSWQKRNGHVPAPLRQVVRDRDKHHNKDKHKTKDMCLHLWDRLWKTKTKTNTNTKTKTNAKANRKQTCYHHHHHHCKTVSSSSSSWACIIM